MVKKNTATNILTIGDTTSRPKVANAKARFILEAAGFDKAQVEVALAKMVADGTTAAPRITIDPFGDAAIRARKIQSSVAIFNAEVGHANDCILSLRVTFTKNQKSITRKAEAFLAE